MRIASWNINGVASHQGLLLFWLGAQKPDLVALQKILIAEEEFPIDVFAEAGYYTEKRSYRKGHRGNRDYGVAILSRKKPRILEQEAGPRLLTVEVDGLKFSSVYAPYDEMQPKLDWFESLTARLKTTRSRSEQRILCGDFNVVPEYRYGPDGPSKRSPNYHEEVQERFNALLEAEACLIFTLIRRPDWRDRFVFENRGARLKFTRLEYVLGTQGVVDRNPVVRFDIDHAIIRNGAFHWVRAPIIADLDD